MIPTVLGVPVASVEELTRLAEANGLKVWQILPDNTVGLSDPAPTYNGKPCIFGPGDERVGYLGINEFLSRPEIERLGEAITRRCHADIGAQEMIDIFKEERAALEARRS